MSFVERNKIRSPAWFVRLAVLEYMENHKDDEPVTSDTTVDTMKTSDVITNRILALMKMGECKAIECRRLECETLEQTLKGCRASNSGRFGPKSFCLPYQIRFGDSDDS